MSQTSRYVTINGETSDGVFEWAQHPRLVWIQVVPIGLLAALVFGMIAGMMADGDGASVPLWATVGAIFGSLLTGAFTYYMAAARMELKRSVLRLSTGQKKANVPMGAIAYIGKAEFTKAGKWRMSRLNFVVEPGPGLEICSRDGKYLTISTPRAEEVFHALRSQGMNEQALLVSFPQNHGRAKQLAWREPRGAAQQS